MVLPVGKSSMNQPVTESLQEELSLISLPKDSVFLAGYDFGTNVFVIRSQNGLFDCHA